jgi:hypothetical protein
MWKSGMAAGRGENGRFVVGKFPAAPVHIGSWL